MYQRLGNLRAIIQAALEVVQVSHATRNS